MSQLKLLCFPYAGGSSWNFRQLASQLRGRVDVVPIDLPGRGRRRGERCIDSWPELETALAAELRPQLREPYALLGYSFGALVALNVMHRLAEDGDAAPPSALIACALRGPTSIEHPQLLHRMDDRAMFEALRNLGGVPDELLASPELITLSAPSMRADLRLFETHAPRRTPLDVPVFAYYGRDDDSVGDAFASWREETRAPFHSRAFDGGHMFIHQHVGALADALMADLIGANERRHIV
jgi:medium-chain acyl-[acyl-carrier-protein] hydrolase